MYLDGDAPHAKQNILQFLIIIIVFVGKIEIQQCKC